MIKVKDIELWNDLRSSVQPLDTKCVDQELPPRLKVRRVFPKALPLQLDLHQMTIQEAYQSSAQFIEKHYKFGTKQIQIITGKSREGKGLIHGEFAGWLDTNLFKQYIRSWKWTNDEGAVNLWLKKNK